MESMNNRKIIFKCVYGSHLFGLNGPKSDKDFKGIVLPSREDYLFKQVPKTSYQEKTNNQKFSKNSPEDSDTEWFTLKGFFRLCQEGQTVSTEMLFCPENFWLESSPEWLEIIENRDKLIHRGFTSFFGYARQQAYKYSNKGERIQANHVVEKWAASFPNQTDRLVTQLNSLEELVKNNSQLKSTEGLNLLGFSTCKGPQGQDVVHIDICGRMYSLTTTFKYLRQQINKTLSAYGKRALMAAENDGSDWKALSHALRVGFEAIEFLSTGKLTLPRPEKDYLLSVKEGKISHEEVQTAIESFLVKIPEASKNSSLPDKSNQDFINSVVSRLYKDIESN
jgi:predicted nucleotidyltransferase